MKEHGTQTAVIIPVRNGTEQMSFFGLFIMVIFPDNPSPKVKRV